MRSPFNRKLASAAGLVLLLAPLAACGEDSDSDGGSGSKPEAVAVIDAVEGESTAVALDKGFTDALGSLGLTPGVAGAGDLVDGSLVFPISGGNVSVFEPGSVPNYVVGQLQHEGSGFTLTAGDTEVTIGNLNVDPGVSRVYGDVLLNGEPVVSSAYIFRLDGRTLKPLESKGNTAILEGTKVYVSDVAAGLLNDTFGTDAVTDELLVGVAKITVNTK